MCSCLPHYLLFEPVPPTQQGRPLSVCSTGGKLDYQWMLACIMKNIELAQKIARENNARAQQKMKECYDRTVREPDFLEGSTYGFSFSKARRGFPRNSCTITMVLIWWWKNLVLCIIVCELATTNQSVPLCMQIARKRLSTQMIDQSNRQKRVLMI